VTHPLSQVVLTVSKLAPNIEGVALGESVPSAVADGSDDQRAMLQLIWSQSSLTTARYSRAAVWLQG